MKMRRHSLEAVAGENAQPRVHESTFHTPNTPVQAGLMALYQRWEGACDLAQLLKSD